jgi:hypothetical protein
VAEAHANIDLFTKSRREESSNAAAEILFTSESGFINFGIDCSEAD